MAVRLDWQGHELVKHVAAATVSAMNDFDDAVAEAARHDHPGWNNQTGEAEASITAVPARATGGRVESAVGFGIGRGKFLEFTARGHPGDRTVNRAVERLRDGLARRIGDQIRK